jgi:hypothetical protein
VLLPAALCCRLFRWLPSTFLSRLIAMNLGAADVMLGPLYLTLTLLSGLHPALMKLVNRLAVCASVNVPEELFADISGVSVDDARTCMQDLIRCCHKHALLLQQSHGCQVGLSRAQGQPLAMRAPSPPPLLPPPTSHQQSPTCFISCACSISDAAALRSTR